jgi:hypothetical protein|tara:strand:+ start:170 stop:349 length:180 start_codon:yes stop_codon:yes gene_type:complete
MTDRLMIKIRKIEKLLDQPLQADTRRIWQKHLKSLSDMITEKEAQRVQALARLGGAWIE